MLKESNETLKIDIIQAVSKSSYQVDVVNFVRISGDCTSANNHRHAFLLSYRLAKENQSQNSRHEEKTAHPTGFYSSKPFLVGQIGNC